MVSYCIDTWIENNIRRDRHKQYTHSYTGYPLYIGYPYIFVQRIQFRASTLVYKSLHYCGTAYVKKLICQSILTIRQSGPRSSLRQSPIVSRYHNKLTDRVFLVACPLAWNNLHDLHINSTPSRTTFRKLLKIHLFSIACG